MNRAATSPIWSHSRGDGVPAVLIHGQTIDHRMMLPLDPVIAAAGSWRRDYIDLPGHGHSRPVEPMTTDRVVAVVADHLRAALGTSPFAVVGASFGGAVAIALTELFGDQVLGSALLAPAVLPRRLRTLPLPRPGHAHDEFLSALTESDRAAFASVTARPGREQWDLFTEHVRPGLAAHDATAIAELAAWQSDAPARRPRPHDGRHLIVTGKQDTVVGWLDQQALLDVYPHATYAALDDCGHNPHLEQPETVAALLTTWLISLPEYAGYTGHRGQWTV